MDCLVNMEPGERPPRITNPIVFINEIIDDEGTFLLEETGHSSAKSYILTLKEIFLIKVFTL